MRITIGTVYSKKRSGVFSGVMYKPHDVHVEKELYRIIIPKTELFSALLTEDVNIQDVCIEDEGITMTIHSAWITQEETTISIEFDSYGYGNAEYIKSMFIKKKVKKNATKHSL